MADVKKINGYDINDDASRTNIGCTTDTYDSSKTYAIDDIVVYKKKIYKCITEITAPEAFDSAKWQQICLRDLIIYLNTKKQDVLTAGDNITIENGVISATDTTYTAGSNITIENGVISSASSETLVVEDLSSLVTVDTNIVIASSSTFLKYGKLMKLTIEISRDGNWTVNDIIASIPKQYAPSVNENFPGYGIGPEFFVFRLDTDGNITIRQKVDKSNWLAVNFIYLLD